MKIGDIVVTNKGNKGVITKISNNNIATVQFNKNKSADIFVGNLIPDFETVTVKVTYSIKLGNEELLSTLPLHLSKNTILYNCNDSTNALFTTVNNILIKILKTNIFQIKQISI